MRHLVILAMLVSLALVTPAYGKKSHYEAVVAEPFLELHTGPGRGYPVFHVVDRGDRVEVLKRRTDWFRVRTPNGIEGWVKLEQIAQTLDIAGMPTRVEDPGLDTYAGRRWEAGVGLGELEGATVIALYGAYHWTRNLSTELRLADLSGDFSTGWLATVHVVHQPFPEWRISPFASLGTGAIRIEPRATLVQAEDRTDQVAQVGLGVRMYLTKRILVRAEYNSYLTFTSREVNEELDEWKAGFAFFF